MSRVGMNLVAGLVAGVAMLSVSAASAADVMPTKTKAPAQKSIWEQDTLTGDWGGARTALKDKGIDLTLVYIGETFSVLSGGLHRRGSYLPALARTSTSS